jgi:hypothetical protein
MRIAFVELEDNRDNPKVPEKKASRYTVRPGTHGSTLIINVQENGRSPQPSNNSQAGKAN